MKMRMRKLSGAVLRFIMPLLGLFLVYGCYIPASLVPVPKLDMAKIEKIGEEGNPFPKSKYTCNYANRSQCDNVNKAKKAAVGKGIVSDELGKYYFESPSEEYISTLFFNQDELLLKKLMKSETGVLSPLFKTNPETLSLSPDWEETARLHGLLSGKLGLTLLSINDAKKFYQKYATSSWEDAIGVFKGKAAYLILPELPDVTALAANKLSGEFRTGAYYSLYAAPFGSQMIFIPFESLDKMGNVELEFNPVFSSYCGVDTYENQLSFLEKQKAFLDYYFKDPDFKEGFDDCIHKYVREATKRKECMDTNTEKHLKRILKEFASKRTSWQERIKQKAKIDDLTMEFCVNALKKVDNLLWAGK